MTELVTLNAARDAQQMAILAQRQDYAPPQHQHTPIQVSQAGVQPDARRAAAGAEAGAQGNSQQDLAKRGDRQDQSLTGPSRPRVDLAVFTSAPPEPPPPAPKAEPVPTGDGEIGSAPTNNLANSPVLAGQSQAAVEVAIAQRALHTSINENVASNDPAARNLRLEAAARALRASSVFGGDGVSTPELEFQKFADKAAASTGAASGQPVPDKFYGKGAEAVVGQFAAPDQPQKFADKAAATLSGTLTEPGSGEAKFYDKVAQTETDFAGGEQQDPKKSYYENAQEASGGSEHATSPETPSVPLPTPGGTKVSVQVTA